MDDHRKDNERCAKIDCGPQPWCFWGLHLYRDTTARGSARCAVAMDVAKLFPGRIRQRAPIYPPYLKARDFCERAAGSEKNLPLPVADRGEVATGLLLFVEGLCDSLGRDKDDDPRWRHRGGWREGGLLSPSLPR